MSTHHVHVSNLSKLHLCRGLREGLPNVHEVPTPDLRRQNSINESFRRLVTNHSEHFSFILRFADTDVAREELGKQEKVCMMQGEQRSGYPHICYAPRRTAPCSHEWRTAVCFELVCGPPQWAQQMPVGFKGTRDMFASDSNRPTPSPQHAPAQPRCGMWRHSFAPPSAPNNECRLRHDGEAPPSPPTAVKKVQQATENNGGIVRIRRG
jgi:hypothetical protein